MSEPAEALPSPSEDPRMAHSLGQLLSLVDAIREDGWENPVTGLGGLRDKAMAHTIKPVTQLSDEQIDALFNGDDLAARIVNDLPQDACRAGFLLTIKGTESDESTSTAREILDEAKRLQVMLKLRQAWIWGRAYGGGAVFVGAVDGKKVSKPLDLDDVRTLRFLNVLRRPQLRIEKRYDRVDEPKFGEPELYRIVVRGQPTQQVIHESRLIMFGGQLTARSGEASVEEWDYSVLQRVLDAVRMSSSSWMSVSHLLLDASQGVLKIKDFLKMLAAKGEDQLRKRMAMVDLGRAVCRALVVDADSEGFERVATSFAGIPETLEKIMLRVSSAAEMPQTKLFGRAPSGMNATGESDMKTWYDRVDLARDEMLKPALEQIVRLIMATADGPTKGKQLDEWEIHFPPLVQQSDKERADAFKVKADALVGLVNGQIIDPLEAALKLAHDGDIDELDVDLLEEMIDAVRKAVAAGEPDPRVPELDPDADPNDPNADPNDAGAPKNQPQDKSGTRQQPKGKKPTKPKPKPKGK